LLGLKNTTTRSARGAHFTTAHLQLHASAEFRPQLHFSERNLIEIAIEIATQARIPETTMTTKKNTHPGSPA